MGGVGIETFAGSDIFAIEIVGVSGFGVTGTWETGSCLGDWGVTCGVVGVLRDGTNG